MEGSMEQIETKLSRAGRNCNSRTVERITGNARKMKVEGSAQHNGTVTDYTFTSQLAVLRSCPVAMARLLKDGGSHLLVAQVLVLSRLLHKALSAPSTTGGTRKIPPIVDQLWERILSARRRLLRRIDKRLENPACAVPALVETMCAYALVTSSTPTQLLRHFHKSRLDSILGMLRQGGDGLAAQGAAALRLCIQTCQDTQAIFPRRLADALAKLKTQPLIRDAEVRALYELNLDIHDRWIGDEARDYTPWPRHDELQRAETEKILHQWSKQAIAAFLGGIKTALEDEEQLEEVASLRQELVETWILSGSRMAGVKSANVLDDLRDAINGHLESIVRSRAQNLKAVVIGVSHTIGSRPSSTPSPTLSLWSIETNNTSLADGAAGLKSSIQDTHQGRDGTVINIVTIFDAWMKSVLQVKGILKMMKDARWDDTFADDADDSDSDDFGESRTTLLNQDDPQLLEEVTQNALAEALQNLGKSFAQIVRDLTKSETLNNVQQICYILRVMREIGEKLPALKLQDKATPPATPFTLDLLKPLYTALAQHVVQPSTSAYGQSLKRAIKAKSRSHILWEGHPPLPAQPSPTAFRYVQDVTRRMGALGSDLWAPPCVAVLKEVACESVKPILQSNIHDISNTANQLEPANGLAQKEVENSSAAEEKTVDSNAKDQKSTESHGEAAPNSASSDDRERKLKQAAFDALYIQRFMAGVEHSDVLGELFQDVAALDETSLARLTKSAADYARKTYLLFALLV